MLSHACRALCRRPPVTLFPAPVRAGHAQTASGDALATITPADQQALFEPDKSTLAALVQALRDLALEKPIASAPNSSAPAPDIDSIDPFHIESALLARKGDVPRALALARNYAAWRIRVNVDSANPVACLKMREQLKTGILISPGTRDKLGRAVLYLRMRFAEPDKFSAYDTVRLAAFVMEWTVRKYPCARTHGVVFFQDGREIRLRNMDMRVPGELRAAFEKTLPIRIGSISMLNPPMFSTFSRSFLLAFHDCLACGVHLSPVGLVTTNTLFCTPWTSSCSACGIRSGWCYSWRQDQGTCKTGDKVVTAARGHQPRPDV
jgi:CRAL/TRIO domain